MRRLDYEGYIAQLQECKPLEERDMKVLCEVVKSQLLEEANVQAVSSPVTVCGDIHGQLWDLLELLKLATGDTYGENGCSTRFVFMGDYVDRGAYSLETLSLLLVLKARSPSHVTLLRGNHESRHITQVYGFYDECIHKYGNADVWKACCAVFDLLSVAAVIDGDVLCVHGGLSPALRTLDEVRVLARAQEIPQEGAFCDLMWSDPEDIDGWAVSPRGAGWLFGQRVVDEFARLNGLRLIARAHQLVHEGYRYMFGERLVTVWSAPNYCYRCGNVASMMHLNRNTQTFTVFDAAPAHSTPPRHAFSPYFL